MKHIAHIILIITASLLATVPCYGRQRPGEKVGVEIPEMVYDFGTAKETAGTVEHTFVLKNTSKVPVSILTAIPSCGCTVADYDRKPIMPGKDGEVKIKFALAGQKGEVDKDIRMRVKSASGPSEQITLRLKGAVVPAK